MKALTDGQGVDVAVEAVGVPATFTMCVDLVRPGGHVANVGVHGKAVELDLQNLWIQNITITMGLVNTTTLPMLLKLVAQHKLPAAELVRIGSRSTTSGRRTRRSARRARPTR